MFTIIAWILLAVSLLLILFIIIRKFPSLAILNVEDMPGEKEAKFKEKIIRQRVERDFSYIQLNLKRISRFFGSALSNFLKTHLQKLLKKRDDLRKQNKLSFTEKRERIVALFNKAKTAMSLENYEETEKHLIEIISLDAKRLTAFLELAESYRLRKSFQDSKETLEHALKLAQQLSRDPEMLEGVVVAEIHFSLAWLCQQLNLADEALEYVRQALDAEPNNPRYLDLILDLSIMKKDKKLAFESWEKLATVNPENNKLVELRAKIEEIID